MEIPMNLKHKPVASLNDYDSVDGKYADGSDAKCLSLGLAQWNDKDISAKVWRHVEGKWSRQSEELPVHRVLDLALMIIASLEKTAKVKASFPPCFSLREDSISLEFKIQDKTKSLALKRHDDNPLDVTNFTSQLCTESGIIHERLQMISNALKELGY